MVEVCEGAPVAMGSWVLTDRHDFVSCAAVCRRFGQPYINDDNWEHTAAEGKVDSRARLLVHAF